MMKVQWRVVILTTVILVGWLSAAESNRRKVIIHIPHLHHGHKQSVRHVQKGHSHGKVTGKGNGHMHKHHHHFYEDDHGGQGESSHSHSYDEPGHHHHHYPPPPQHHHHSHPPPPHHSSHHSHPVHHHHHPDHHGHGSHHMDHHRHPDHHYDDLDHHHHHLRSEESMYTYDHHHPEHSHQHHRVHHYSDHHHHPSSTTRSYDCMELCEKCRMKARRHKYKVSRGHEETHSGGGKPIGSQVVTAGKPPPVSPAPAGLHQGYLVTESQEFKPILAPGELREESNGFSSSYMFPKPPEAMSTPGKLNGGSGRTPGQYEDRLPEFDSAYADFPEFAPDTRNWYNETFFFGKHEDPGVNVVGYHRQRGQQVQQHSAMHYVDDGMRGVEDHKDRGRDLRFRNRHRYETTAEGTHR